jgi:hypothetical protein
MIHGWCFGVGEGKEQVRAGGDVGSGFFIGWGRGLDGAEAEDG